MEVPLGPEFARWIEELVQSGRYASAGEVVEAALGALRDSMETAAAEIADFNEELERRLASLDRGESMDPAVVRAELQRKSAERRRKTA